MRIPKVIRPILKKWFYRHWPGQAGSFPYFGTRIFFQPDSHLFDRVCEADVYEDWNLRLIRHFLQPGTTYLDVGANIGLMAVPLLKQCPQSSVVSFEPSPNTLPYLMKTHAGSPYKERWRVIPKALGRETGSFEFYCSSPDRSAFDGLKDTGRFGDRRLTNVEVTTLDAEWVAMGRPIISVIKIDVEGAELGVLQGGSACLCTNLPAILLEWSLPNLEAHACLPDTLLEWCRETQYSVYALPYGIEVAEKNALKLQMLRTQDYLLLPSSKT